MTRLVYNNAPFAPAWIALPPWSLSDCIVAVVGRNTQGFNLSEQDRLNYYPTSPYFCVSVLFEGYGDLCASIEDTNGPCWRGGSITICGPQTMPRSVLNSDNWHSMIILFYPDAWLRLTGMDAAQWTNRFVDGCDVLTKPMMDAIQSMFIPNGDQERLENIFNKIKPLWQRCRSESTKFSRSYADTVSPWVQAIVLRAAQMHMGRSLRQVERRIKSWTGTSLRSLNKRARAEQAFFLAWKIWMTSKEIDWASFAVQNGFSDQSHFIREMKEITGFSPQAFRDGIAHQEPFWIYRAWAQLLGVDAPQAD
jgi:AraC-like DNA-binding protein